MIDFGHGVRLGPLDSHHNPIVRGWRNSPKIMRWCRQSTMINDQQQSAWYDSQTKNPSIQMFGIFGRMSSVMDDVLVGVCGLTSIDRQNSRAEISLYVAPDHHGSGFGSLALKTLIDHAFSDLNFHLLWAESFDGNHAVDIFKKQGFILEGVRREFYFKGGKYIDAPLMSLLKSDHDVTKVSAK